MISWAALLDWIKVLTPKLMLSICILSAVLLFIPGPIIASMGLAALLTTNRPWVALTFLGSTSLLLGHAAFEFLPKGTKAVRSHLRRKHRAHNLSRDEKRVLQMYINNNARTQRFGLESGIIAGLVAEGFLLLASKYGDPVSGFPFNITEWAYNYFSRHSELITTPGIEPYKPLDGIP